MPGHCLIVPMEHVASCRMADEAVWTEMRNFKKCLVQMYAEQARPRGNARARAPLAPLNSGCRRGVMWTFTCLLSGAGPICPAPPKEVLAQGGHLRHTDVSLPQHRRPFFRKGAGRLV